MLKTAAKILTLAFACSLFLSSNAFAIPMYTPTDSTSDSRISASNLDDFFTNFNFFTGSDGIFGFYDADDPANTIDILSGSLGLDNSVIFTEDSNMWYADVVGDSEGPSLFNKFFGFFFSFMIGTETFTYYSDGSLNDNDGSISIDYDPDSNRGIFDFYYGNDLMASVIVDDVAPVPEPSTVLLFGTGIAGLAGVWRKRSKEAMQS